MKFTTFNEKDENGEERKPELVLDPWDYWSPFVDIAHLLSPLLKNLREKTHGYPCDLSSLEEWQGKLDTMILAFDLVIENDGHPYSEGGHKLVREGLKEFAEYYMALWD